MELVGKKNLSIQLPVAIALITLVIVAVLVPGFGILYVFNRLYPSHVSGLSSLADIMYLFEYLAKASLNIGMGWITLMLYGDLALPAINYMFKLIFSITHVDAFEFESPTSEAQEKPICVEPLAEDKVWSESAMNHKLIEEERNDSGIGLDEY